jgi:general secretion pathway protein G
MTRQKPLWLILMVVFVASSGFVVIKECVDPMKMGDLKINKVLYADLPTLSLVLESFVHDHGEPPTEAEGLSALVCTQPNRTDCINRLFPDPWLHPYAYRRIAKAPGYIVYSVGANGIDERGGGDDVVTWPKHYTCREYGVGCVHVVEWLEFPALLLVTLSGLFLLLLVRDGVVAKVRSWKGRG